MSTRNRGSGAVGAVARALLLAVVGGLVPAAAAAAGEAGPPSLGTSVPARHTALLATFPAADSLHEGKVEEVRLRFSTAVQLELSTITLSGPSGPVAVPGEVELVPGTGDQEIRIALAEPLPSGSYTVEWASAGPDSHPLKGTFSFAVEWTPPPPAPEPAAAETPAGDPGDPRGKLAPLVGSPEPAEGTLSPAGLAVRWGFFLSLVGMLGVSVFRLGVLGPLTRDPLLAEEVRGAVGPLLGVAWGTAALAVVALPARLWLQASELFGAEALAAPNLSRLLASRWGGAWVWQAAMAGLFVAGLALVRGSEDRRSGWRTMLAAGAGMAFVPALSGHASAVAEPLRRFAVLNDAVHVASAGVWMGTLAVLLLAGLRSLAGVREVVPAGGGWEGEVGIAGGNGGGSARGGDAAAASLLPPLARLVNSFSRMAVWAVGVLVATGVLNASMHLGSPSALFLSGYGRTLLLKLALAAGALALGFYNWRVVRPALTANPTPGRLRRSALAEVTLGVLVLAVTAALVVTPPPTP